MKYSNEINDFFKRHNVYSEEMFRYLERNTYMVDYRDEEARIAIGCAYAINNITKVLEGLSICIPYNYDDITTLISIHEITHGIIAYKHLNKKYNVDITCEALPMLYEKLYVLERQTPELIKYEKYLDSMISDSSSDSYKYGLYVRDTLLENYNNNYNSMDRLTRKLVRKYNKEYK